MPQPERRPPNLTDGRSGRVDEAFRRLLPWLGTRPVRVSDGHTVVVVRRPHPEAVAAAVDLALAPLNYLLDWCERDDVPEDEDDLAKCIGKLCAQLGALKEASRE